jgi:hypothetical protein
VPVSSWPVSCLSAWNAWPLMTLLFQYSALLFCINLIFITVADVTLSVCPIPFCSVVDTFPVLSVFTIPRPWNVTCGLTCSVTDCLFCSIIQYILNYNALFCSNYMCCLDSPVTHSFRKPVDCGIHGHDSHSAYSFVHWKWLGSCCSDSLVWTPILRAMPVACWYSLSDVRISVCCSVVVRYVCSAFEEEAYK